MHPTQPRRKETSAPATVSCSWASDSAHFHGFDDVAHVAGRLPARLERLCLPRRAPCAHQQLLRTLLRREGKFEFPERVATQVVAESRRLPRSATIARPCDLADAAPAVECNPARHDLAAR